MHSTRSNRTFPAPHAHNKEESHAWRARRRSYSEKEEWVWTLIQAILSSSPISFFFFFFLFFFIPESQLFRLEKRYWNGVFSFQFPFGDPSFLLKREKREAKSSNSKFGGLWNCLKQTLHNPVIGIQTSIVLQGNACMHACLRAMLVVEVHGAWVARGQMLPNRWCPHFNSRKSRSKSEWVGLQSKSKSECSFVRSRRTSFGPLFDIPNSKPTSSSIYCFSNFRWAKNVGIQTDQQGSNTSLFPCSNRNQTCMQGDRGVYRSRVRNQDNQTRVLSTLSGMDLEYVRTYDWK